MSTITKSVSPLLVFFFLLAVTPALAVEVKRVPASEAIHHVGEIVTVCGTVAETRYLRRSSGRPTYLNFDQPYPDNQFTAVVWGKNRRNFDYPLESLEGKLACVYGEVKLYKKKPRMLLVVQKQVAVR